MMSKIGNQLSSEIPILMGRSRSLGDKSEIGLISLYA